jgi:3-deoxy-D-manno-octulosonate 8-phosphate phosphatase KdsC-like HAD superfamily phosphatase
MGWFEKNCDFETTAFIADGYNDAPILKRVKVGIAPISARIEARESAKYITPSKAGEGAVLDACLYLERIINGLEEI